MNVKYNPLKHITSPSLQTYFMLVLFSIWCVFFGLIAIYYMGLINYSILTSIVIHASILIPMMITNAVFIDAERNGDHWLKEWQEVDYKYKVFLRRIKMEKSTSMIYVWRLGLVICFNGLYLTFITLLQVLSINMIVLLNKFGLFI